MTFLLAVFYVLSVLVLGLGMLTLSYFPLALIFELRKHKAPLFTSKRPLVSIIVPAYNEGKVIANCIESIMGSAYRRFEIILVDDGSKDGTYEVMKRYAHSRRIKVVSQPNRGKAAALNTGISLSRGEILFFVDADGIFTPTTIQRMLDGFVSEKVGAVCGNDAPVNLDRLQTQLMCIQTHVGTGFVRRALAEINCLPIVSGNIGAFRRSVLEKTGPFSTGFAAENPEKPWETRQSGPFLEGFIGEDLELTWRVHKAGYKVNFAPRAVVLAEVPPTVKSLWKQRVRWARGLLQSVRLHPDMFFNLKLGPLGLYMPINFLNMVIVPLIQLVILILFLILVIAGFSPIPLNILSIIGWLGISTAVLVTIFGVGLDGAWKDLRFIYVIPFWIPYSIMMDIVTFWAIILEIRGKEATWNKFDRTGVISRKTMN